jgi:hypothetical protein
MIQLDIAEDQLEVLVPRGMEVQVFLAAIPYRIKSPDSV